MMWERGRRSKCTSKNGSMLLPHATFWARPWTLVRSSKWFKKTAVQEKILCFQIQNIIVYYRIAVVVLLGFRISVTFKISRNICFRNFRSQERARAAYFDVRVRPSFDRNKKARKPQVIELKCQAKEQKGSPARVYPVRAPRGRCHRKKVTSVNPRRALWRRVCSFQSVVFTAS